MTPVGDPLDVIDFHRLLLVWISGDAAGLAGVVVALEDLIMNHVPQKHPLDVVGDISATFGAVVPPAVDDGFIADPAEVRPFLWEQFVHLLVQFLLAIPSHP
ncbi:hypothetical protein [Natronorubrum sp. FCH18a]|uniref:hypothetical protein n=1 Tax=Natronorubrum sp. FCH18a TaxID=3447018 RepID=UPI003F515CBB